MDTTTHGRGSLLRLDNLYCNMKSGTNKLKCNYISNSIS